MGQKMHLIKFILYRLCYVSYLQKDIRIHFVELEIIFIELFFKYIKSLMIMNI